ncbi:MAG: glycoside hydrolase family 43 protein [Eubacterium sp.]|nr:glycoside hydrolase family 43 protein [Eubacterium sp.]
MMKKKIVSGAAAVLFAAALAAGAVTNGGAEPKKAQMKDKPVVTAGHYEIERASVHDPSIAKDMDTGTYYVFGSHLATAKSEDLVNWTQISADYKNTENHPVYGRLAENLAESFAWAGHDDGDCLGRFAVWAPDVHWFDQYTWEDGSKGAYLLYYSATSTWRRSCIGFAASKTIEGPYAYVDTLVYSGMTADGTPDGNSSRNTKWDNDYLNFNELIEKGSENGGIDEVSEKWLKGSEYNTDYAPNAIDPTIVRGAEGKMYMVYGSWSGGLFLLEIDPQTGRALYPGKDSTDEASGNFIDRYYGCHIAGANHESGEGAYILYDEEAGYYYLYETYGALQRKGGYNMRLFRSEHIYGPYTDAAGGNAADNGVDNYKYGIKLIGNYAFEGQRGYRAAGHNSALIDGDGSRYLIYHQRFDEGTEYHEVRVHQQFLNEDKWPVTAVYENRNETIANYEDTQVTGSYELINHSTGNETNMQKTEMIELHQDGKVSGALTGIYFKIDSGKGYDYLTLDTGFVVYKGIFFEQTDDAGEKVMTFSAIGSDNTCIWGSM